MLRFELSASVVLWREGEILVMKRGAGSFSGGGWLFPGGHVEAGERPTEACARELFEETGIAIDPTALALVDVMTYLTGGADGVSAHTIIYAGTCPERADAHLNDEHVAARWMTPEGYIARFLDGESLRARGLSTAAIALADEVARVTRAAAVQHRISVSENA